MRDPRECLTALLTWGPRHWLTALVAGVGTGLVVAVSTALIPTPIFGRSIAPEPWAWPVVIMTSVLTGLLVGTYVRTDPQPTPVAVGTLATADDATASAILASTSASTTMGTTSPPNDDATGNATADEALDRPSRLALTGGVLAWFAVGCPVCNKLVLLALGASGAVTWFAPVQPFLAAASIALLGWALRTRLLNASGCALPSR